MSALAKWLAADRMRRVVFIAGLFPLLFFGVFSAAAVVMTARLHGARNAIIECAGALVLVAGIGWILDMNLPVLLVSAVLSWTLLLGLGEIVRRTQSLTLAVQLSTVLALAGLLAASLAIGDPVAYWVPVLEGIYKELAETGVVMEVAIEQQAQLMNGLLLASALLSATLALVLGNAMANQTLGDAAQASRTEFRSLRLGFVIGVLAALAGLVELLGLSTGGALLIFGVAFMYQGMAVVAWWATGQRIPAGWMIGLCILLVFLPGALVAALMLFATLGFTDNWYSLRRKAP